MLKQTKFRLRAHRESPARSFSPLPSLLQTTPPRGGVSSCLDRHPCSPRFPSAFGSPFPTLQVNQRIIPTLPCPPLQLPFLLHSLYFPLSLKKKPEKQPLGRQLLRLQFPNSNCRQHSSEKRVQTVATKLGPIGGQSSCSYSAL